ncbi:hypothetical protein BH23ACT12_BH23ACT12_00160 [soil metagenome]
MERNVTIRTVLKSSLAGADRGVRSALSRLRLSTQGRLPAALWIPVAAATAYLFTLAFNVRELLEGHYHWRPDFVWAPLLARDLAETGGGGLINVGDTPHYSTIWFLVLTEGLPFSRQLWEVAPFLITLCGLALMAWSAHKVAGSWAGFMTMAIGVAGGPAIFATTLTEGMRSHTWFAVGATSAFLIFLATRPESLKARALVGISVLAGTFTGITLASDPLFAVCGLAPLLGTATLGWLIYRTSRIRDLAIVAWATSVLGIGLSVIIENRMQAAGYRKTLLPDYSFVTLDQFLGALKALVTDILTLTNGNFFGQRVGLLSLATLGIAVLSVVALSLPFFLLKPRLRHARTEHGREPWMLYVIFWTLAMLATAAAYLLSPIPTAFGQSLTTRYLVPVFYGIAAIVPVWAAEAGWRKILTAGATTVLCMVSLLNLRSHLAEVQLPIQPQAAKIAAFLDDQGLERGYASYRIAHTFTYSNEKEQRAYPVYNCEYPEADICPFYVNTRTTWYEPQVGAETFLIADPPDYLSLTVPAVDIFGEPKQSREFGGFTVLVYDYDIASRFSSAGPPGAD